MLKRIAAVILGVIAGFLVVGVLQQLSAVMYPPPADLIIQDKEAMEDYFVSMPAAARAVLVLSHITGCYIAAYLSSRLARRYRFYLGLLSGFIILVAAISHNLGSYAPLWALAADLSGCAAAAYYGARKGSTSGGKQSE